MVTNGGFLVTKIKQLGDRIFEKVLAEKGIDAFNGAQGRILYVLWQQDGVPIKTVSDTCGLAITSLTTMLERMERHLPDHDAGAYGAAGADPQSVGQPGQAQNAAFPDG